MTDTGKKVIIHSNLRIPPTDWEAEAKKWEALAREALAHLVKAIEALDEAADKLFVVHHNNHGNIIDRFQGEDKAMLLAKSKEAALAAKSSRAFLDRARKAGIE